MFILGKLVGWVASVEFLFALPLAIALVVVRSRPRLARSLLALLLLAVLALTFLPVGSLFLVPLEERFPRPAELPAEIAGIVVLGGSVNLPVSEARRTVALGEAAERLTAAVALARHYPDAKLWFSGGTNRLQPGEAMEADEARVFFSEMGLGADRVILEAAARTTYENAERLAAMARPTADGGAWLLVTSANHMPRSVGVFRKIGWPVIAYPVDYRTTGRFAIGEPRFIGELANLDSALHEWVGLVAYRLLGYTDSLLPAP